jgi:hypothetical protein
VVNATPTGSATNGSPPPDAQATATLTTIEEEPPFQAAGAKNLGLFFKLFSMAAAGQGRRHDHETTVDHALMRGLVAAGPVIRRGASSV